MLFLRRQGCTTGQGFHFSPPVCEDDLRQLLLEQTDEPTPLTSASLTTPA
jgi:EAL domain-containing protein (putative c-di-GMP-specific phosphodiesterase class I)